MTDTATDWRTEAFPDPHAARAAARATAIAVMRANALALLWNWVSLVPIVVVVFVTDGQPAIVMLVVIPVVLGVFIAAATAFNFHRLVGRVTPSLQADPDHFRIGAGYLEHRDAVVHSILHVGPESSLEWRTGFLTLRHGRPPSDYHLPATSLLESDTATLMSAPTDDPGRDRPPLTASFLADRAWRRRLCVAGLYDAVRHPRLFLPALVTSGVGAAVATAISHGGVPESPTALAAIAVVTLLVALTTTALTVAVFPAIAQRRLIGHDITTVQVGVADGMLRFVVPFYDMVVRPGGVVHVGEVNGVVGVLLGQGGAVNLPREALDDHLMAALRGLVAAPA